jgi:hypothetical protein
LYGFPEDRKLPRISPGGEFHEDGIFVIAGIEVKDVIFRAFQPP